MLRPGLADSSVPATLQGKVAANLNAAQAGSLAAQPGIISRDDARKTNNQASFGGSLLRNDMDVEASMELAPWRHLDETGLHHVYTVCTCHSISS